MATRKIKSETTFILPQSYMLMVWSNLKGAECEEVESFYKQALKRVEVESSNIIRQELNELGIRFKENDKESYESALNRLKMLNKRIVITDFNKRYDKNICREYPNVVFCKDCDDYIYAMLVISIEYGS